MKYGLPEQAIDYVNLALTLDPRHYRSWDLLGLIRLQAKDYRQAARLCIGMGIGATALVLFNLALAGTPFLSVRFDWTHDLLDTWVGLHHGLFTFAPWTLAGFVFALRGIRKLGTGSETLLPKIGLAVAPFALIFSVNCRYAVRRGS
jgi:hypothetical protein